MAMPAAGNLYTRDKQYIATVRLPLVLLPDLVIWGDRYFVFDKAFAGQPRFVEAAVFRAPATRGGVIEKTPPAIE